MSFSKLTLLAVASAFVAGSVAAHADSFTLGSGYAGPMTVQLGKQTITGSGGNFSGSTGVIDGKPVSFSEVFCVDLLDTIKYGPTYQATYDTTGQIFGSTVHNDAAIAWLILNDAPSATTQAANEIVQVAIWELEYGNSFELISADPGVGAGAAADYTAALAAVSGLSWSAKNALVGDLDWISPTDGFCDNVQGMVGLDPVPEPGTLSLLGTGILGLAGLVRRRMTA